MNISEYLLVSDEPNEIVIEAALTLQNETRCCVTHCLVHDTSGEALRPKHVKPLSHRIVRLLDRTIGCYVANVRPIGNVCYDRQQRSPTAIGLSSWW